MVIHSDEKNHTGGSGFIWGKKKQNILADKLNLRFILD